jgi:hypothetical protein
VRLPTILSWSSSRGSSPSAPARFALARLPHPLATLSISMALSQLLATSWERQYARVYACVEILRSMAREPAFPDTALAPVMEVMLQQIELSLKELQPLVEADVTN